MKLLITGASGFIGQHVLRQCIRKGHHVTAIIRPQSAHISTKQTSVEYVYTELAEISLEHIKKVDVVIHLAATWQIGNKDPWPDLLRVNMFGTLHLCNLAALASKPIVISGSAKEYGLSSLRYKRIPVSAPLEPITAYAASKASAYHIASSIARTMQNPTCYLRIFNAYGPGQNPHSLWPSLYTSAIGGTDLQITSGSQIRDFIHVSHVAALIISFCEKASDSSLFPVVYNIGSGEGQTVYSFCQRWWRYFNAKGKIIEGSLSNRIDDVSCCVADISNWPD